MPVLKIFMDKGLAFIRLIKGSKIGNFIERENFRPTASYLKLGFFQLGGATKYIVPHFVLGTAPKYPFISPPVTCSMRVGVEVGDGKPMLLGDLQSL